MPKAAVKGNVLPFRRRKSPLTPARALALLREKEVVEVPSVTALGELLGWERTRATHALRRWEKARHIAVERDAGGGITVRAMPADAAHLREFGPGENRDKPSRPKRRPGRPKKRRDPPRSRVRRAALPERAVERENTSAPEREGGRAVSRGFERETDRENSENSRAVPTSCQNKETPVGRLRYLHGSRPESTPGSAENTSGNTLVPAPGNPPEGTPAEPAQTVPPPPADPASMQGAAETLPQPPPAAPPGPPPPHPPVPHADRLSGRRRGGDVTGGGGDGPGFDAVDTFRKATWFERLVLLIAFGLSGTAAWMSVTGMVTLVPWGAVGIMVFCTLIELMKFFGFGVVSAGWRKYGASKWFVAGFLLVGALINCAGVYGWMIMNHTGPAAARSAAYTERDADAAAKIEVAAGRLADIERRIRLIDDAADGAARRGRSRSAISVIESQKKNRAGLAAERDRAQQELAALRAGRSGLAANREVDETAAMPVRAAMALFEDVGLIAPGTDPEKLFRWLAFMVLLAGDPTALAVMVMINSRARRKA